jgi:hypothetical protein
MSVPRKCRGTIDADLNLSSIILTQPSGLNERAGFMGQSRHSLVDEQKVAGQPDERGRGDVHLSARMRVHAEDAGFLVRLRNVSAGGLMAELPHPLPPDSAVEIKLNGLGWVAGRVVWQTEGRTGIAFDNPIDVTIVQHDSDTAS